MDRVELARPSASICSSVSRSRGLSINVSVAAAQSPRPWGHGCRCAPSLLHTHQLSAAQALILLPILHRLIDRPRGVTRALVLTPTRELAAQILEDLNDLAVHTPITAAAVFGGVGMGPQEHAFRSGADVIIATPGRLLDHFRFPYAKLAGLEILVLDEADRMLDMGFLPEIRKILRHLPAPKRRQTLFFSATMPDPILALTARNAPRPGHHQPRSGGRRRRWGSPTRSIRCRRS